RLHPKARLIRGWPRPRGGVTGLDASFAAAMFIGYHAREGTRRAVLSHTFLAGEVADFRINGRSIGEGEFNAIVAGALGVPVVLVSGDDVVVEQMRAFLGDVEGVVVKRALSRTAAVVIPPQVTTARLKAAAERALRRRDAFKPVRLETPYRVEFVFKPKADERIEQIVRKHPEISQPAPRTLARTCQNVDELIDFYMTALGIGLESPPVLKR
ncbi:MAG: aminopeptidase, partial [Acidobacteria bacterium]